MVALKISHAAGHTALAGGRVVCGRLGPVRGDRSHAQKSEKTEGGESRAESLTAAARFSSLAASSPHRQGQLPLHGPINPIGDRAFYYA